MMMLQILEDDGDREQAVAQAELARTASQQAANDAARQKMEQQLTAALDEANRLRAARESALHDSCSQVPDACALGTHMFLVI